MKRPRRRTPDAAIARKIARLRANQPPRLMDLFAGCGGLTLGFTTAGFEPVASVESDEWAAASHGANFARFGRGGDAASHSVARDIVDVEPGEVFRDLGLTGAGEDQIDVLVGGPPCQAFARVGRAKLRHEARKRREGDAEDAHVVDGRVSLYERYLYYVRVTKPVALLMENVPDILNHGGRNVAEVICAELRQMGYRVRYTLLNASWFGVPQVRERMFLVAYHEALNVDVTFPAPTHHSVLPGGYQGTRKAARQLVPRSDDRQRNLIEHGHRWIDDPVAGDGLPTATTALDALADLPSIHALDLLKAHQIRRGRKDPSEPVQYTASQPSTRWSALMRRWPGFSTTGTTTGHVIRYLPRDFKIFRLMQEGWQYPQVWNFIEEKRSRILEGRWSRGLPTDGRLPEVRELTRQWTLPYDPTKFPNKWWKLERDKPVRTLMAHLGKDSYSHIHFDSAQARTISVREAARLQSFPDGFILKGTLNPAFKQIGNAVPPLVAYALAVGIRKAIGCQTLPDIRHDILGLDRRLIRYTAGRE